MSALKRWRWPLVVVAALLGVSFFAWRWLASAHTVPALELRAAPLVRTLQFSARVSTLSRVDIGATVTGRVSEVQVRAGDRVARGALLLSLEPEEAAAALAQALATEGQAQARIQGLRGSSRQAAQAAVSQAQANVDAAEADIQRTQDLVSQGFLSSARLDEARRALGVARAQQALAQAQRDAVADAGTELVQAQAQKDAARAAATAARARLAQMRLTAPADAQVLSRQVEPGQIVQPGRVLLSLALRGPLELVAQVDERYLQQLAVEQPAFVVADAFAGQRFQAHVRSIAPVVDVQRGAIELRLSLLPPVPTFLREDMTVSVEVETGRRSQALAVPLSALQRGTDENQAAVWVDNGGRAELRPVQLGLRTLSAVEVRAGLRAGELVLLRSDLKAGARVRPDTVAGAALLARESRADDAGQAMMNAMGR